MKQFDSASIRERLLTKLSQSPDWKAIASDSVVSTLVTAVAEVNAETARYAEYMFKESKWDTAQNLTSVGAAASQLGYKPARKTSAFGEIYISADPKIHLVGRQIFKDDFLRLEDDIAYVPNWGTLSSDILLNQDVVIVDSSGNNYTLTSTQNLLAGSPWSINTIMQGVKKSITIPLETLRTISSRSRLDPSVYVPIQITDCENAGQPFSEPFFRVFVNYSSSFQEYRVVDSLAFIEPADFDVEVFPDLYNSELLYLRFNASPSRGSTLNLTSSSNVVSIEIRYIETKGYEGNLTKVFQPFTITNIPSNPNLTLYGINLESVIGGSEEETASDMKRNAPLYYLKSYTAATKEAYENLIKRIDFDNKTYPDKVRVFPGVLEEQGVKSYITYATFIAPALEDKLSSADSSITYDDIERLLNFYLSNLKAPTDVIKFAPPNYTRIGIGITSTASQSEVTNLVELRENIRDSIDAEYGAGSPELDFDRSVYESDIIDLVKNYDAMRGVRVEMEAVKQLDWSSVIRMKPDPTIILYTARLGFDFSTLFKGRNFLKGFKDYRTGASYMLRFDIFFKKSTSSTVPAYHTSIFIKEDPSRGLDPFYHINDMSVTPIWDETSYVSTDYPFGETSTTAVLNDSYQFYLKKKIFSDDAFTESISAESLEDEPSLTDYTQTPGMISSYLVWSSGDSTGDESIGSGYFEFDVTSMYYTLQKYAEQDQQLYQLLQLYPLSNVKCDAAGDLFTGFVNDVLSNYVEMYVSARPFDKDLVPEQSSTIGTISDDDSVVLYIDSADQDGETVVTTNLSVDKRARFLSVEIDLV